MDAELGRLVRALRDAGRLDETLLIVTSDHGEEFLEHGRVLHGATHHAEVLRVPLLFRGPDIPPGRRVGVPTSLVDVAPTILGALATPIPEGIDGIDLSPQWRDVPPPPPDRPLFSEADNKNVVYDAIRTIRWGRWKLHSHRETQEHALYDVASDPEEREDVAAAHPDTVRRLLGALQAFTGEPGVTAPQLDLTRDERRALEALGYLGESPR